MIAIYVRTSTTKQETSGQVQAISDWVKLKQYNEEEIRWFEDSGQSGKTLQRTGFQNLMGLAKEGKVSKVITFELSRISRDFLGALNTIQTLTSCGVIVEIPREGELPFTNVMDQFMVAAKSLVSAQERAYISRRTREKLAYLKAQGVQLGRPKCTPGRPAKRGWRKSYDPELVRKIMLGTSNGLSCSKIANLLSDQHFSISESTVHRIRLRHRNLTK